MQPRVRYSSSSLIGPNGRQHFLLVKNEAHLVCYWPGYSTQQPPSSDDHKQCTQQQTNDVMKM